MPLLLLLSVIPGELTEKPMQCIVETVPTHRLTITLIKHHKHANKHRSPPLSCLHQYRDALTYCLF